MRSNETTPPRLLSMGPILIDDITFVSAAERLRQLPSQVGGNAVIFAAAAAAAGSLSSLAGRVGDAPTGLGRELRDLVGEYGVDTAAVNVAQLLRTPRNQIDVREDDGKWEKTGELTGDPLFLDHAAIASVDRSRFDHLHVGGLNALVKWAPNEVETVIARAREVGLPYSVGFSSSRIPARRLRELATGAAFLFFSRNEYLCWEGLTESDKPPMSLGELSVHLNGSATDNCFVTLGDDGVLVRWAGCPAEHFHARPVDKVRSTLGAGDIFAGTFVSQYLSGVEWRDAVDAAQDAAAASVAQQHWTGLFGQPGMSRELPRRELVAVG